MLGVSNTGLVCISGTTKGASVDTGFLTVKNTTGAEGASGIVGGFCPIGKNKRQLDRSFSRIDWIATGEDIEPGKT